MIIEEIHEFDYELFLAEQELYESFIDYGSILTTESYGLFLLNEGVKETIIKYLEKVRESIGKVWNSFKETMENTKDKAYLKLIESKINDADPKFTISNFPTYNISKLNGIKTEQLNFESMKDDLTTKDSFIAKYYPNIKLDDKNKSFKDAIKAYCLEKRGDERCTKEMLRDMYKFCSNTYSESVRSIEEDIKKYNTSAKNIQNLVNQVTSAETSQNECVSIYESYLFEAENDQKDNNKIEFKDDPNAKQQGQGNNEITKKITNYVQITTDILSAKLSITKEIYNLYMNVLHHYIKPGDADNNDKKETTNNDNSSSNTNGSVEVEI